MLPSPTSLLPAQRKMEPVPAVGPSKLSLALGSSFAHGDQFSHLRRSFTWAKTSDGSAANAVDRATRYFESGQEQMGLAARKASIQYDIERTTKIMLEHYSRLTQSTKPLKQSFDERLMSILEEFLR